MVETPLYRPPKQETMLLDLVERLGRLRDGRIAVHLHLSKLSNAYSREKYLRIAFESFSSLISGFEGHLFQLTNGDIFYVAKDLTSTLLKTSVERVKNLFSQDPLLEDYNLKGQSNFYTWYDVERDYDALLQDALNLLKEAELSQTRRPGVQPPPVDPDTACINPDLLSRLEKLLETVDVTNIARRQTVCTLTDEKTPHPLFEEIFISIGDLQNIVAPGFNLGADTWLFRYLTRILDHRVMLMLLRDGVTSTRPFSLNLNVATVLTSEFSKFEAVITPQLRGRLVIEFNKLDVFSDMGAFMFARDYLHDRGFRLCLDGITHHTLPYCNRTQLGFDLLKLNWTPNALNDMLPSMKPEIRNLVMESGQAHTILCRCDNEHAVDVGQELGIVMFQGRQIDRLLQAARIPAPSKF